jgi:hypothetical protein
MSRQVTIADFWHELPEHVKSAKKLGIRKIVKCFVCSEWQLRKDCSLHHVSYVPYELAIRVCHPCHKKIHTEGSDCHYLSPLMNNDSGQRYNLVSTAHRVEISRGGHPKT